MVMYMTGILRSGTPPFSNVGIVVKIIELNWAMTFIAMVE
jgi:hypothetical protein